MQPAESAKNTRFPRMSTHHRPPRFASQVGDSPSPHTAGLKRANAPTGMYRNPQRMSQQSASQEPEELKLPQTRCIVTQLSKLIDCRGMKTTPVTPQDLT